MEWVSLPNEFWKSMRALFLNNNEISCLVVVQNDSILAFHSHGMQGRSLRNGAITQEITDMSKTYKLLGSEK